MSEIPAPVEIRRAGPGEREAIRSLLRAAGLPVGGLRETRLVVAGRPPSGVAGLEIHGTDGLLRSVAVHPDARGTGLGAHLVRHVLADARHAGLGRIYLLTTTAAGYFPRFGFRLTSREAVTGAVRESAEFTALCPASAAVLVLDLAATPEG